MTTLLQIQTDITAALNTLPNMPMNKLYTTAVAGHWSSAPLCTQGLLLLSFHVRFDTSIQENGKCGNAHFIRVGTWWDQWPSCGTRGPHMTAQYYPKTLAVVGDQLDQKNTYRFCAGVYKKWNPSPSVIRTYAIWNKKSYRKNPQKTKSKPFPANTGIFEEKS